MIFIWWIHHILSSGRCVIYITSLLSVVRHSSLCAYDSDVVNIFLAVFLGIFLVFPVV